jgi:nucleoside 2-deoxyribosyltransferase
MEEIIYLAIPYTFNPYKSFRIANEVAAKLMQKGKVVFSPISHSHVIADHLPEETRLSQSFWMHQDIPLLKACDKVLVVIIGKDGYDLIENSKGCQNELAIAKEYELEIEFYHYECNE